MEVFTSAVVCVSFRRAQTFSLCTVARKARIQQCILICFFFLLVLVSFYKNILLVSPHVDDVFPRFSLSSMTTTSTSSTKALERWEDKHVRLPIASYMKFKDEFGKSHITQLSIWSEFWFGRLPFSLG